MTKISLLFITLSLFFTFSCASTKLDNYHAEEPVLLYKTDFSTVSDRFKVESAGEIAKISGGVLHLGEYKLFQQGRGQGSCGCQALQ